MERHFDEQLTALKHDLIKMSAIAETMIHDAVKVLIQREASVIPGIYRQEEQVNRLQVEIDEACFTLIALHQPAAGDLRFILGATKTTTDLERLADQAVNICNKAEKLLREPPVKEYVIIPQMARIATAMVNDSLHAYVNRDLDLANRVMKQDDQLDAMKLEVTAQLVELMEQDVTLIHRCMELILVARNLERIGDHATNIAENIIFVVQGKDVRHHREPEAV